MFLIVIAKKVLLLPTFGIIAGAVMPTLYAPTAPIMPLVIMMTVEPQANAAECLTKGQIYTCPWSHLEK